MIVALRGGGSPLVLGVGDDEAYLASDIPALLGKTREVVVLADGEMAILRRGHVTIQRLDGEVVHRAPTAISADREAVEKGGYPHFMLKEIFEQPKAVLQTVMERIDVDGDHVDLPEIGLTDAELMKISRVLFVACGTSWHAGLVGKYLIEDLARMCADAEIASEFRHRRPIFGADVLTVPISQSGETADTLAALRQARRGAARAVAICNVVGSSVAREADGVLYTRAGLEIGVGATKSFTTQLAAVTLLALKLATVRGSAHQSVIRLAIRALRDVPDLMAELLNQNDRIRAIAERLVDRPNCLYLGRGLQYPLALEGALKLKEISYVHAEGYPAGEMKHGPIALIDPQHAGRGAGAGRSHDRQHGQHDPGSESARRARDCPRHARRRGRRQPGGRGDSDAARACRASSRCCSRSRSSCWRITSACSAAATSTSRAISPKASRLNKHPRTSCAPLVSPPMNGLARLTPRLVQSVVLGVTLIVSLGALADRIGSDRVSSHVLVAAGLLLVLPFACSAALYTRRLFPARTLIVGTGALARKIVEEIRAREHGPDLVVGIADDVSGPLDPAAPRPDGGSARHGWEPSSRSSDPIASSSRWQTGAGGCRCASCWTRGCRGIAVEDAVDLYERLTGKLAIESLTPSNLISSTDFRKSHLDLAFGHAGERRRLGHRARRARAAAGADCAGRQARFCRTGVLRPGSCRPGRPAIQLDQVPDDAPGRRENVGMGRRQRRPRDPSGAVSAQVPARRAAAVDQRDARRDEPGRPAAASRVELRAVPPEHSLLLAPRRRPAGAHRMGAGAPGVRQRSRRRDREDALRPVLHQAHVRLARSAHPRANGEDRAVWPGDDHEKAPRVGCHHGGRRRAAMGAGRNPGGTGANGDALGSRRRGPAPARRRDHPSQPAPSQQLSA